MKYIDIHTHTVIPKTQENRISFYNRIVGQETLGDLSHIEMFSVGIHPWFIHSDKSNDSRTAVGKSQATGSLDDR